MARKQSKANQIVLNVEDIRLNANPEAIATMMSALIHVPSYRKRFEADPVSHLRELGIQVPRDIAAGITPQSIRTTLDELTEGGEERVTAAVPGVAVAVRVGTRPGTRPGVSVGVRVATGTSVFARAQVEQTGTGLAARQRGQRIKRAKRAPDDRER